MWISTKEKLPEEGKYVLARHTRGTWRDSSDQDNVNCVVVKLVSVPLQKHSNNQLPYKWSMFGPDNFNGQDISHWQPIEPVNTTFVV